MASREEYFGEMPWLALDFSDRKLKEPGPTLPAVFPWEKWAALQEQLSSVFKVQGIPSLAPELQGCGRSATRVEYFLLGSTNFI